MLKQASISELLLHLTIRLEVKVLGGISVGTGFFFNFCKDDGGSVPTIVTNKHVVKGANEMDVLFTSLSREDAGAPPFEPLHIKGMLGKWIEHPNPEVDLCVLPIEQVLSAFNAAGRQLLYEPLDASLILREEEARQLSAIEQVTMIGYPNGLWDDVNNLPIVRTGVTATPVFVDYKGKKEFLIDAACYPGSSGSPVLLYNEGAYPTSGGIALGSRLKLLGIMYKVPVRMINGEIVVSSGCHVESQGMLNLGFVIKATELLRFEPLLAD